MSAAMLLAELLTGLFGSNAELTGTAAGMAALAVAVAGAALLTLVLALRAAPLPVLGGLTASAVRRRGERTVFLTLCDPAAAGRPRPRAPSH